MRIQTGQLVSLGYGKYVRSEDVVAIEAITDGRGPGRRTMVWVRGVPDPLIASRADASIVDDLVTPAEDAARLRQLRGVMNKTVAALEDVPTALGRVIEEESGVNLRDLVSEAKRVLD